jgi:penicillin-binding protein 1B
MALKIKIPRFAGNRPWATLLLRAGLIAVAAFAVLFLAVWSYFNVKYGRVLDERLKQPIFANTAKIYAAPREVRPGQKLTVRLIANELREAGYTAEGASQASQLGTYSEGANTITVRPGPQSYHTEDSAAIRVESGVVNSITDEHGQPLASYELEPQLITGLSDDANRTKRRLIAFDEIPQNLVHAVLAIEDRRFFEHSGVNYFSMVSWAWHHAARKAALPLRHRNHQVQADPNHSCLPARASLLQKSDLRDVRQSDPARPARQLRH